MSTSIVRALDLDNLVLLKGCHKPDSQFCVMEAVAYVAGEEWSDAPQCASRVIGAFMRRWNDSMNDEDRQLLKPYIPRLVGTAASPEVERRRAYMAADWASRTALPMLFRRNGWIEEAERLEQLQAIVSSETAQAATIALQNARDVAWRFRSEQRAELEAKLRESLRDAGAAGDAWAAYIQKLTLEIKEISAATPKAQVYDEVYAHVYSTMRPRYDELFKELRAEVIASGFQLLDAMIAVQVA